MRLFSFGSRWLYLFFFGLVVILSSSIMLLLPKINIRIEVVREGPARDRQASTVTRVVFRKANTELPEHVAKVGTPKAVRDSPTKGRTDSQVQVPDASVVETAKPSTTINPLLEVGSTGLGEPSSTDAGESSSEHPTARPKFVSRASAGVATTGAPVVRATPGFKSRSESMSSTTEVGVGSAGGAESTTSTLPAVSSQPSHSCRPAASNIRRGKFCKTSMNCPSDQFCTRLRKGDPNICTDMCNRESKSVLLGEKSKESSGSSNLFERLHNRLASRRSHRPLEPRANDVWVVSYPKSGSTWVRHMITNLYHQSIFENFTSLINFTNVSSGAAPGAATFDEVDRLIPFLEDRSVGPVATQFLTKENPRIFKSHQPYNCEVRPCRNFLGNQATWQCACPNCALKFNRVIYIVRDGRAVMKSYFKFRKELNHVPKGMSFGKWLQSKNHYPGPTWADHVLSWKKRLEEFDKGDYLWLRYESILKDPEATMRQLASFLKFPNISDDGIRRAALLSSREAMQKLESRRGAGFFAKRYQKRKKAFQMVHNKSSWRSAYDEPTLEHFMRHNGGVLKCLGYLRADEANLP